MAGDNQNENAAADGEYGAAADDDYWSDESFENYVPSTIDPGWWMTIATLIFCVLVILGLSYLLWLTQKNRKQVEAQRNAALERLGNAEEGEAKDDKVSLGTASTEDDSDGDSIVTEIEDDDDSVMSADTTATFIDLICSCGDADMATSPVTMPKKSGRYSRGVAKFFNGAFELRAETRHLPLQRGPSQNFVRHGRNRVVVVDTSGGGFDKSEKEGEDEVSEYHKMEEAEVASPAKLTSEQVKPPPTFLQTDPKESTTVADYHQMDGGKAPKRRFFKRFGTKKAKPTDGRVAQATPEINIIKEVQEASSLKPKVILEAEGGLIQPEGPTGAAQDNVAVYHELNDDTTSTAKTSTSPVQQEPKSATLESSGYSYDLQSSSEHEATSTDIIAHHGESGKKRTKMRRGAKHVCRAIKSFGRKIRRVAVFDSEMTKLLNLAIPYTLTSLAECMSEIITVAVIGKLLGTQALSAYIAVEFGVSVTTDWLSGPIDSLSVLCSQAIGVGEKKLAGEYVQIAVVISQIMYLPQMVFWMFFMKDLILWFGFSDESAEIGYSYAIVTLIHGFFGYVSDGLHSVLEVCDHERLSALTSISNSLVNVLIILSVALASHPSLQMIGIIHFVLDAVFFIALLLFVGRKGLLDEYRPGMVGSFAMANKDAVKRLLLTAVPLSIANILSEGEFQILLLFASMLGPAEVVAWGLVGELWAAIETVIQALGDAAEVRCAYLIGANKPMRAKQSAQKSMLVGVIQGFFFVGFLAVCGGGGFLSEWLTNDPTVQTMLKELIPLICIGTLFETIGSISFALLGGQGCYGLATSMYFIGSWLVTLPLALIFALVGFNLQGLACAVVVGSVLSGVANTFLLLDSDWYYFADTVRQQNKAEMGH